MQEKYEKATFTLSEAAQLLSCHTETLRRAIHAGQLRAAKLGRGFRISRIDLEEFWTSKGGGMLFEPMVPSQVKEGIGEAEKEEKVVKKQKKTGPQQLSLLLDSDTQ